MHLVKLLSHSSTPVPVKTPVPPQEDKLARESDVTVSSANATPYAEYRGFFWYVISWLVLLSFLIWAFVPNDTLRKWGIHYYPSKYWAQALPAYSLLLHLFLYILIALIETELMTFPINDMRLFTDEHAVFPETPEEYVWKAPSGVWDLPIGLVNEVLYGEGSDNNASDDEIDELD